MREVVRRGGAWPPTSVSANLVLEARAVNKVNSFSYIIKGAVRQFYKSYTWLRGVQRVVFGGAITPTLAR